ncbi:hypothetical protein ASNO1_44360 [Corallococcus caeni]|uniref:Uncharacterized protein n=1 Tax=Corallococcus caeni TaxID=3082388 RepID=A0ABQ6QVY6_9BACT|nr:hypothetical protein ASNO1_44360 [Corallococcus sp. NO1]
MGGRADAGHRCHGLCGHVGLRVAEEARKEEAERIRESCTDEDVRSVDADGERLQGRVKGESRCDSWMRYA